MQIKNRFGEVKIFIWKFTHFILQLIVFADISLRKYSGNNFAEILTFSSEKIVPWLKDRLGSWLDSWIATNLVLPEDNKINDS